MPDVSEKSKKQFKKVVENQRTGKVTTADDVSEPDTQKMLRAVNSEQARGTNTVASQADPPQDDPYTKRKKAQLAHARKIVSGRAT